MAAAVRHRTVEANGISMHVAEAGPAGASAPAVLFVHGFPELWYSWRHQMDHLAARGYRCLAPDLRGYGGTTAPPDPTSYTIFHIVGDLVALLDALQLHQVFVVGHDWGAIVSWNLCLLRPDRVRALVNLSVAFMPRRPSEKPLDYFRRAYGDDYYVCRFQEPGIEAEFASFELKRFFKMALSVQTTGSFAMSLEKMRASNKQITLPSWLSEEDISYLASVYAKTGFAGGINYYRCLDLFLGFPVIGPTGSSSAVGSPLRQPLRPLADPSSSCCAALIALSSPLSFTRLWPPDSGPRTQIRCFFLGLPGVTASTPRYTTGRPRPSTWRRRGTDARPAPRARGLPLRAATQARTGARQVGGTPAAHRRQGESDRGSLAPASVRDCESCFHRPGESVVTLFVLTFSFC